MTDTLNLVMEFDKDARFVFFSVTPEEEEGQDSSTSTSDTTDNAFSVLMGASKNKLIANPVTVLNRKDEMHNLFIKENSQNMLFPPGMSRDDTTRYVRFITNTLWYLDGRKIQIEDRMRRETSFSAKQLPDRFGIGHYDQFQNWKQYKKKPRLDEKSLRLHSENLISVLQKPWVTGWDPALRGDIELLAVSLQEMAEYMKTHNEKMMVHHSALQPARQISQDASVIHHSASTLVPPQYIQLDEAMHGLEDYDVLYFEDTKHASKMNPVQRHRFLANVKLSVPVDQLRFDPGGGVGSLVFFWRTPANRSENESLTMAVRTLDKLRPQIPIYHTRAMRKEFSDQIHRLKSDIPPHVLRTIYTRLCLDASADRNPNMDERIRLALSSEEPELILDLRHLNVGRPSDTFDAFFRVLQNQIEEWIAVDDRRHGIAHMSQYLSIPDMISQVKKDLPPNTPVPSETTVALAFAPPNSCSKAARNFTGKLELKHQVQVRQLRQNHQDAHFCAALFKYMRQMAVQDPNKCLLLSCDDKAKIMLGEPGLPITSGVRGRRSIMPASVTLSALDHDVQQKASLVPSVILDINIPMTMEESFYSGQVIATIKDAVFEPSSPNRFVQEVLLYWNSLPEDRRSAVKTLLLYTDGGPEHRSTFESVKIALIYLFRKTGVDRLVAARTAPGQSYLNPVERVMSILNIALQNTALERDSCSEEKEKTIKACNTMTAIRTKESVLKDAWLGSVSTVKATLKDRFERCTLKGTPFKVMDPATEEEVSEVTKTMTEIDRTLDAAKLQKQHVKRCIDYSSYKEKHCLERHYCFQVRKCTDSACCNSDFDGDVPQWLPDPVLSEDGTSYKPFLEVVGTVTTDVLRPSVTSSVRKVTEEEQGCPTSILIGQNVRHVANCQECNKPRCIYCPRALSTREASALKRIFIHYEYICGSVVTPEDHPLEKTVFSRLGINCFSPIEWAFYSSTFSNLSCAICGEKNGQVDANLKKRFKTVLPLCLECQNKGLQPLKRGPLPTKRPHSD